MTLQEYERFDLADKGLLIAAIGDFELRARVPLEAIELSSLKLFDWFTCGAKYGLK